MIPSKLMNDLGKRGFKLDFPSYTSNDDRIFEIIKEDNPRLNLAIPLLLREKFDHLKIIQKISNEIHPGDTSQRLIKRFKKIILISKEIFKQNRLNIDYLEYISDKYKLKESFSREEFNRYHEAFKESIQNIDKIKEDSFEKQIEIRGILNTNRSLERIYSPAKRRIMGKIFSYEPLTNTELKYYYKSIRPLSLAILNESLSKYLRIIESSRKYKSF